MSNKIEQIKRVLKSGAKATKYVIRFSFPPEVEHRMELSDMACLASASTFPGVTIGQIEVFNQGRKLPIPGDTSYDNTWSVTFYVDQAHQIRKDMLEWMKACDNFQANTHSGNPAGLFVDITACQLDSLEKPVTEYKLKDCWPQQVGEISIAADSLDTLQTFDVTFSFSNWLIDGGDEFNHPQDSKVHSSNVLSPDQ